LTEEAGQRLDNSQAVNFTPTIIIIGLAAVAVAAGALIYFKKRK
jgi:LPXTG-motif cell wall-anchored protein